MRQEIVKNDTTNLANLVFFVWHWSDNFFANSRQSSFLLQISLQIMLICREVFLGVIEEIKGAKNGGSCWHSFQTSKFGQIILHFTQRRRVKNVTKLGRFKPKVPLVDLESTMSHDKISRECIPLKQTQVYPLLVLKFILGQIYAARMIFSH